MSAERVLPSAGAANLVKRPGVGKAGRRDKRMMLLCSGVGLLAAIGLHMLRPVEYESRAKLYVRYIITESKNASATGLSVMADQMKTLRSMDLLRNVVVTIGPGKILPKAGGEGNVARAVAVLQKGLTVTVPRAASVLDIVFRHADADIVQPVLDELVNEFLKMQYERWHKRDIQWYGAEAVVSNIIVIQAPAPAFFDRKAAFLRPAMVFATGLLVGLTWVILTRLTEVRRESAR